MKKLLIILLLLPVCGFGQSPLNDFFYKQNRVTWLGLDFTHAKMIGAMTDISGVYDRSSQRLRANYWPMWNQLILQEPKKFNIKGALNADTFIYNLQMITNLNAKDTGDRKGVDSERPNYTPEDIQNFVNQYDLTGFRGVVTAFIIEAFDKIEQRAIIHFVAIDPATKQVLIHQRIVSKPSGITLRNYWGGAIAQAIRKINGTYYDKWKESYRKTVYKQKKEAEKLKAGK